MVAGEAQGDVCERALALDAGEHTAGAVVLVERHLLRLVQHGVIDLRRREHLLLRVADLDALTNRGAVEGYEDALLSSGPSRPSPLRLRLLAAEVNALHLADFVAVKVYHLPGRRGTAARPRRKPCSPEEGR